MNKKIIKTHLPIIDITKCVNCDLCYITCQQRAIIKATHSACAKCIKYCVSMKVPCNPEHYIFNYENCNNCGLCISICKSKAIYWHKVVDLDCSEILN